MLNRNVAIYGKVIDYCITTSKAVTLNLVRDKINYESYRFILKIP